MEHISELNKETFKLEKIDEAGLHISDGKGVIAWETLNAQ